MSVFHMYVCHVCVCLDPVKSSALYEAQRESDMISLAAAVLVKRLTSCPLDH